MSKRFWFYIPVTIAIAAFLFSACTPSVARIDGITHSPEYPKEGGEVVFTINYKNSSTEESLQDVILEVTYDEYLMFLDAVPVTDDRSENTRSLIWKLGTLQSGDTGSVEVKFELAQDIPYEIYELTLDANVSGQTSQGNSSGNSDQDKTLISDHPSPTPTPSPVTETYEAEGVTVTLKLPWQGKEMHGEERGFDFDPMTIPVVEGYSIIRPIIYLDIFDEGGMTINDFSPPIELTVEYTSDDLRTAEGTENLVLLLYDRVANLWIACDGATSPSMTTQCNKSAITPSTEDSGYGSINVSRWTSAAGWGKRR